MNKQVVKTQYGKLVFHIGQIFEYGRNQAYASVNHILVKSYWQIGKVIVEYEQEGRKRAGYGEELLKRLSKDLKLRYGKGFSRSNLQYMRLLYLKYPKCQTLSGKLSWSHYNILLSISNDLARKFYEKECINTKWSVRELKRQANSMLFERLALSKDKNGIIKLSNKGQVMEKTEDVIKDPYILEFLDMKEKYCEKDLEIGLINHLQKFLLELG